MKNIRRMIVRNVYCCSLVNSLKGIDSRPTNLQRIDNKAVLSGSRWLLIRWQSYRTNIERTQVAKFKDSKDLTCGYLWSTRTCRRCCQSSSRPRFNSSYISIPVCNVEWNRLLSYSVFVLIIYGEENIFQFVIRYSINNIDLIRYSSWC